MKPTTPPKETCYLCNKLAVENGYCKEHLAEYEAALEDQAWSVEDEDDDLL